jgi:CelD/BcsL family acetyltransferase involved in cellulose biosynthesis
MMRFTPLDAKVESQFLDPEDERWLAYIRSKSGSTIFHHPAWLRTLAECYGYRPFILAVCDAAGAIRAGLPLMEVRSLVSGRRWVSLPFTDYCSPLHDDEQPLRRLVGDLASLYKADAVPKVEVRWELPALATIRRYPAFYLHTVRLESDPQRVLTGFKRSHRQNIGAAEKRGVQIKRGTEPRHLRQYYDMQLDTRQRKGLPVQPWKFFEMLGKHVFAQRLGFVLLAYKDSQCLAGGVFLHWQQTLTYKYAASSGEGQEYRPNNLLTWTAMRWGCEKGMTTFDLGRTGLENAGLQRFKRGWGAAELPLSYSLLSDKPPKVSDGRLMLLMESFIQKAPPWVCRVAGELLYRHYG